MVVDGFEGIQVAIDGPAGAGKGSAAKLLAQKLGLLYLDTGAMYRSFTYHAYKNGFDDKLSNEDVSELFKSFNLTFEGDQIFLCGKNITQEIRTPQMDVNVSGFAVNAYVRKLMVELQQSIGRNQGIVMEGRDICTVVLKDTPYKFYLDASPEIRAERRYKQNLEKGIISEYEEILKDIKRRDRVDSSRAADPLKMTDDSKYIDNSDMTVEEVVDDMIKYIQQGGSGNL